MDENVMFFKKLSVKEKFSYGLGDLASNLVFAAISSFMVIFWTDVAGIAAASTGIIILVSKIWDGINDPIMGFIVDRTNTKYGKTRPYLIWMSIPLAISAVLAFMAPFADPAVKIAWATFTYILVTTLYTAINIPYGLLSAKMTSEPMERTSLNTYRMTMSLTGSIIISSLLLPIANIIGGGNFAIGAPVTVGIFSLLGVVCFYITFRNCQETVGFQSTANEHLTEKEKAKRKEEQLGFVESVGLLFKNRAWVVCLFQATLTWVGTAGKMAVTAYYAIYVLGRPGSIPLLMTAPLIGSIVGMILLTQPLSKRFGKVRTIQIVSFISGFMTLGLMFVPSTNFALIIWVLILAGFVGGPNLSLSFAMIADTIEYGEYKTGKRVEGLLYSGGSLGAKVGMGLGSVLVGVVLGATGYVPEAVQTPEAIRGIESLMFFYPSIFIIIIAFAMFFSDLDKVYPEAVRALALKKGELEDDKASEETSKAE